MYKHQSVINEKGKNSEKHKKHTHHSISKVAIVTELTAVPSVTIFTVITNWKTIAIQDTRRTVAVTNVRTLTL